MSLDISYTPSPTIARFMQSDSKMRVLCGPVGCVSADTLVVTEYGPMPIAHIDRPMRVLSWNATTCQFQLSWCGGAFPKGRGYLYQVSTQQGVFAASGHHRTLGADGDYLPVRGLAQGQSLSLCSDALQQTRALSDQWSSLADAPHSTQTGVGYLGGYAASARLYGQRFLMGGDIGLDTVQAQADAHTSASSRGSFVGGRTDGLVALSPARSHHGLPSAPFGTGDYRLRAYPPQLGGGDHVVASVSGHSEGRPPARGLSPLMEYARRTDVSGDLGQPYVHSRTDRPVLNIAKRSVKQSYWDMQVLDTNNYVTVDGAIHHNSGKSVAGCFEVVRRASQQQPNAQGVRKTRFAVVRETVRQLTDTTIKTWLDWFPATVCGTYMRTTKTYLFSLGDVECEVMFRALDDADDVANLNSLELTGAFFNECRDIHPDIIDAMSKRIGRYPSAKDGGPTWHGMWADTNPPTMDTWWYFQMEHLDPKDGVSRNDNGWEVFKQPSGRSPYAENIENLPEDYYNIQGRSEEYIRVYIDGEYGLSSGGQPIYKYFRPDYHIAKQQLKHVSNGVRPIIVGMDLGLTPAAVIGQLDPRGRALVLAEAVSFDMGVQRFARTVLKPLLYERFHGCPITVVVDPAGIQRAQTDERSAVDILKAEGFKVIPAKTNSVSARISAVDAFLMRQVDGDPGFLLDPRCTALKAAMMGGYRYKPKGDNDIDKNKHSHIAEALQYLALHIDGVSGGGMLNIRRDVKVPQAVGWT